MPNGKQNVKEHSFEKLPIKKIFEAANSDFSISDITLIDMPKEYVEHYFESYGCPTKDNCYVKILSYFSKRITPSYDVDGQPAAMHGNFSIVMAANNTGETLISVIGDNLTINLGKKCCSIHTLQSYYDLKSVASAKLEQYRLILYLKDALSIGALTAHLLNRDILSPISRRLSKDIK